MAEQFVGCTISLEMGGGLGFYQGIVKSVDSSNQIVTLTKAIHNGKPTNKDVTFNATDIVDLKILHSEKEKPALISDATVTSSKVASSHKVTDIQSKVSDISLDERLKAKNTSSGYSPLKSDFYLHSKASQNFASNRRSSPRKPIQSFQPIEPQGASDNYIHQKRKPRTSVGEFLTHGPRNDPNTKDYPSASIYSLHSSGAYQRRYNNDSCATMPNGNNISNNNNNKRHWHKYNDRNETTFGTPVDDNLMNTDFDFEKNLALFDKRAVMEEIENSRPDVIQVEPKFRCDENILPPPKSNSRKQIFVPPAEAGEIVYITDDGLIVPSISTDLRLNLLSTANQSGHTVSRQLEMMGRAATEFIISVIGGSHRLERGNSHQTPVVVILSGINTQGAAGINCGRQLESQGVQTVVLTPPVSSSVSPSHLFTQESHLYSLTAGRSGTDPKTLPSTVDVILDARFDLSGSLGVAADLWLTDVNAWMKGSRASMIALDPPINNNSSRVSFTSVPKIRLCPALPLAYPPDNGRVYLMNLSIPQQIYSSLGIKYTTPFGAKMIAPLHAFE